jgi:hypothetical protein
MPLLRRGSLDDGGVLWAVRRSDGLEFHAHGYVSRPSQEGAETKRAAENQESSWLQRESLLLTFCRGRALCGRRDAGGTQLHHRSAWKGGSTARKTSGWVRSSMTQDATTLERFQQEVRFVREILLQAKLKRDRQVHGHGLAVQSGRLIFPLTQCVHGGLMEERWPRNNLHRSNVAVGID